MRPIRRILEWLAFGALAAHFLLSMLFKVMRAAVSRLYSWAELQAHRARRDKGGPRR